MRGAACSRWRAGRARVTTAAMAARERRAVRGIGGRLAGWLLALAVAVSVSPAVAALRVAPTHAAVIQRYSGDDGLPQNGVNALLQRRDGHLWVATHGGLAQFDGRRFKVFRAHQEVRPATENAATGSGPSSDRILALHEDRRGRLWIGTQDAGISLYEDGVFRSLAACRGICQASAFVEGADGSLWVASSDGVLGIDMATLRERAPLRGETVRYDLLAQTRDGTIYAGGFNGLAVVAGDRLDPVALPDGSRHVVVLKATGDDLWVATDTDLFRFEPASGRWHLRERRRVNNLIEDAHGRLWLGTLDGQLLHEDGAGVPQPVEGLPPMFMVSLLFDDHGNLWIGSHNKGLFRLREPWIGLMADPQAAMNRPARAVADDAAGDLWFALSCSGLRRWRADGRIETVPLRAAIGSECAETLARDRAGGIWVGTSDGFLGRIRPGADTVEPVASWPAGPSIRAIHETAEGDFWVAVARSTVVLERDAAGGGGAGRPVAALEGMAANQIVAAHSGGLWVVSDQGVVRIDGERILERWTPAQGLSSRFARAVYEDRAGVLWVGTYGGGLNRIRGGKVDRYNRGNGLFDDTVSCILADDEGRLWFGGNRGVSLLSAVAADGRSIETVGFTVGDGLIPAEINGGTQGACHRDAHGRLWFALVEGFAMVDPARARERVAPAPQALIERVAIAGHDQPLAGPLQLDAASQNLEIGYTAVDLSAPERTHFRFRLSGVNDDWIDAGRNQTIVYPSIPWGEHLFEVQARSEGGPWSSPPATLPIHRPMPWYQRPWVWLLATLLSLLLVVDGTRGDATARRSRPARLRGSAGGSLGNDSPGSDG